MDSVAGINERNELFWSGVAARDRQIEEEGNVVLSWSALELLEKRAKHEHEVEIRGKIEEETRCKMLRDQAVRAGRAAKPDTLTKAIHEIVRMRPDVSESQLRTKLSTRPDIELLDSNDHPAMNPRLAHSVRYRKRDGTYKTVLIVRGTSPARGQAR
jgi:hypothetical protein